MHEIVSQFGDEIEPGPSAHAIHRYVMARWPQNRGLIYYPLASNLLVYLPGGEMEWATVTPAEIEAG